MSSSREIRNCQSKRSYPSEQEALWVAQDRMSDPSVPELRPYHCFWCGRWHLSSKPPRR